MKVKLYGKTPKQNLHELADLRVLPHHLLEARADVASRAGQTHVAEGVRAVPAVGEVLSVLALDPLSDHHDVGA